MGLSVSGSISLPVGFLIQLSLSVLYTIAIQFYSALAFAQYLLSNGSGSTSYSARFGLYPFALHYSESSLLNSLPTTKISQFIGYLIKAFTSGMGHP
jgi:hypothetical protein